MFKLLFSAYAIIILPYITAGYTAEFLINNGIIADERGMTDGATAIVLAIAIYLIEQLAATAIIKRLLWK